MAIHYSLVVAILLVAAEEVVLVIDSVEVVEVEVLLVAVAAVDEDVVDAEEQWAKQPGS